MILSIVRWSLRLGEGKDKLRSWDDMAEPETVTGLRTLTLRGTLRGVKKQAGQTASSWASEASARLSSPSSSSLVCKWVGPPAPPPRYVAPQVHSHCVSRSIPAPSPSALPSVTVGAPTAHTPPPAPASFHFTLPASAKGSHETTIRPRPLLSGELAAARVKPSLSALSPRQMWCCSDLRWGEGEPGAGLTWGGKEGEVGGMEQYQKYGLDCRAPSCGPCSWEAGRDV